MRIGAASSQTYEKAEYPRMALGIYVVGRTHGDENPDSTYHQLPSL